MENKQAQTLIVVQSDQNVYFRFLIANEFVDEIKERIRTAYDNYFSPDTEPDEEYGDVLDLIEGTIIDDPKYNIQNLDVEVFEISVDEDLL